MKMHLVLVLLMFFESLNFKNNFHSLHAFHISKTEIEYKAAESALQITTHFFIDDFELALKQNGTTGLMLCSEREKVPQADSAIYNYINAHFSIKANTKNLVIKWLGKERAKDYQAMYVYCTIEKVKNLKSIELTSSIFNETFPDQKNIVQIISSGKKQGYVIFDKSHTTETIKF